MSARASQPRSDQLYLSEEQIASRVGMQKQDWEAAARVLERSGLPKGDPVFNGRRYWPAVRAYLDRRNGLIANSSSGERAYQALGPDGEENWG